MKGWKYRVAQEAAPHRFASLPVDTIFGTIFKVSTNILYEQNLTELQSKHNTFFLTLNSSMFRPEQSIIGLMQDLITGKIQFSLHFYSLFTITNSL
jgi:hypothetical protein